jgi:hypothetical protein
MTTAIQADLDRQADSDILAQSIRASLAKIEAMLDALLDRYDAGGKP